MTRLLTRYGLPAALLLLAACTPAPTQPDVLDDRTEALFPRQQAPEGERDVMEALLIGTLVDENHCLRIASQHGPERYLVIWPPDYRLVSQADAYIVVDEDGQERVRLGQEVYVSGGEVMTLENLAAVDAATRALVEEHCYGPYWLIGDTVRPASDS